MVLMTQPERKMLLDPWSLDPPGWQGCARRRWGGKGVLPDAVGGLGKKGGQPDSAQGRPLSCDGRRRRGGSWPPTSTSFPVGAPKAGDSARGCLRAAFPRQDLGGVPLGAPGSSAGAGRFQPACQQLARPPTQPPPAPLHTEKEASSREPGSGCCCCRAFPKMDYNLGVPRRKVGCGGWREKSWTRAGPGNSTPVFVHQVPQGNSSGAFRPCSLFQNPLHLDRPKGSPHCVQQPGKGP